MTVSIFSPQAKRLTMAVLRYAVGLGLGGFLLYYALKDLNWSKVEANLADADYWWLAPAFAVGIMSHIARGARWRQLIEAAGYRTRTSTAFWAVMTGYLTNNAVPRLGEITRCTMLTRTERVPFVTGAGTVVVERITDLAVLAITFAIVLLAEFDELIQAVQQNAANSGAREGLSNLLPYLLAALGIGLITALLLYRFRRSIEQTAFGERFIRMLRTLVDAFFSIRRIKQPLFFLLNTVLIWAGYVFFVYFAMEMLPPLREINSVYLAFVATAVGAIGMVVPSPGGIGSYHFTILITFSLFGHDEELGGLAGLLLHTPQYLLATVIGAVGYLVLIFHRRTPSNAASKPVPKGEASGPAAEEEVPGVATHPAKERFD